MQPIVAQAFSLCYNGLQVVDVAQALSLCLSQLPSDYTNSDSDTAGRAPPSRSIRRFTTRSFSTRSSDRASTTISAHAEHA